MIVSDSHQFIFIHNPKVAGTSFRRLLEPFASKSYHGRSVYDGDLIDGSHIPLFKWPRELVARYRDGYTVFGLVRDPESRYRSAISELLFQHPDFLMASGFRTPSDFLGFFLTEEVIKHDPRFVHFSPQWSYYGLPCIGSSFRSVDFLPRVKIYSLEWLSAEGSLGRLFQELGLPNTDTIGDTFSKNDRPSFNKPESSNFRSMSYLYGLDLQLFSFLKGSLPGRAPARIQQGSDWFSSGRLSTNRIAEFARSEVYAEEHTPQNIRERNAIRERIVGPRESEAVLRLREALGMETNH